MTDRPEKELSPDESRAYFHNMLSILDAVGNMLHLSGGDPIEVFELYIKNRKADRDKNLMKQKRDFEKHFNKQ